MSNSVVNITPLRGEVQGDESFQIKFSNGEQQVIKGWDYAFIYSQPFLYSKLYCDLLGYNCVQELATLLLKYSAAAFDKLRVLDVACGSGLMGKYLKENSPATIETLVGTDILPEAILALKRDYPGIYDDAFVVNEHMDLSNFSFNCLSISGGASHLQLEDIASYLNLLEDHAFVVFNLLIAGKDDRRERILAYMNSELAFCDSKIYNHRKLGSGKIVLHEAFLFEKRKVVTPSSDSI